MTRPTRLIDILTLKCEAATALASRAMEEPLGWVERLALLGHLLACAPCRHFRRQIALLRELIARPGVSPESTPPPEEGFVLSEEARSRLLASLRSSLDVEE